MRSPRGGCTIGRSPAAGGRATMVPAGVACGGPRTARAAGSAGRIGGEAAGGGGAGSATGGATGGAAGWLIAPDRGARICRRRATTAASSSRPPNPSQATLAERFIVGLDASALPILQLDLARDHRVALARVIAQDQRALVADILGHAF